MSAKSLCEVLSITYPIIQGGMAWISDADLAAAVSNAGGLGVIAAGNAPASVIAEQLDKIKNLTDRPYGLNVMLMSPFADDIIALAIEKKVPVVLTGAGSPGKYMSDLKAAGIKIVPVIPSVALARRMEGLGADAVVAEGMEAGGHIGTLTTMTLVPQVVDGVDIPVIAAGGIADGRGMAAAFALGASGIQVGTRFLVATECNVHPDYKQMILDAKDTSTGISGNSTGHPVRVIKNRLYRQLVAMEKSGESPEAIETFAAGALRKAAVEGDITYGSVMAGQSAGLVHKAESSAEIVQDLLNQFRKLVSDFPDPLK
ncbi:MAG: enoyl-[acyl-carrier protein] reductase [Clostridiales bacterium]|jgi:enoyl-[acyl-carrier protein] reductase II|nr:enoyl-[acyl-carrier protein] reductase [Clostridiales bacterium]